MPEPPLDRYSLVTTPTARRQLTDRLPEGVAAAADEFITGPLLDNLRRIGKRLSPPFGDRHAARRGTYRIIYRIDEPTHTLTVVLVEHRRDAYRRRRPSPSAVPGASPRSPRRR